MLKIKVIKQEINVPYISECDKVKVIHILYYNEKGNKYYRMKSYSDWDYRNRSLSELIVETLEDYFGEVDFEVNFTSEHFECECCGSYSENKIEIINRHNTHSITISEDTHFGGHCGYSDEETIADWEFLGFEVEIEYI